MAGTAVRNLPRRAPDRTDALPGAEIQALGGELLARGSPIDVELRGGCMRPWAFPGDFLQVAPLRSPLRPGMVVLLAAGDSWIAHRVVSIERGQICTRGDLEPCADPWISPEAVLGQVVAVRSAALGRTIQLDGPIAMRLGRLGAPLWRGLRQVVRVARRAALG